MAVKAALVVEPVVVALTTIVTVFEAVMAETATFTFNGCTTTNPGIIRGHIAGVFLTGFTTYV